MMVSWNRAAPSHHPFIEGFPMINQAFPNINQAFLDLLLTSQPSPRPRNGRWPPPPPGSVPLHGFPCHWRVQWCSRPRCISIGRGLEFCLAAGRSLWKFCSENWGPNLPRDLELKYVFMIRNLGIPFWQKFDWRSEVIWFFASRSCSSNTTRSSKFAGSCSASFMPFSQARCGNIRQTGLLT